jgi:hypothetical protein
MPDAHGGETYRGASLKLVMDALAARASITTLCLSILGGSAAADSTGGDFAHGIDQFVAVVDSLSASPSSVTPEVINGLTRTAADLAARAREHSKLAAARADRCHGYVLQFVQQGTGLHDERKALEERLEVLKATRAGLEARERTLRADLQAIEKVVADVSEENRVANQCANSDYFMKHFARCFSLRVDVVRQEKRNRILREFQLRHADLTEEIRAVQAEQKKVLSATTQDSLRIQWLDFERERAHKLELGAREAVTTLDEISDFWSSAASQLTNRREINSLKRLVQKLSGSKERAQFDSFEGTKLRQLHDAMRDLDTSVKNRAGLFAERSACAGG